MKNMMMRVVFMMLLVLAFTPAFPQGSKGQEYYDGWALTKKGDTLKGKICYENTKTGEQYEKIFFLDATGQKKRFGGEKLVAFSCNGRLFEFIILPVEDPIPPMLMETILKGDVILYKHLYPSEETTPQKFAYDPFYYLVKKDKPEFAEIGNNLNEKNFRKLLKDFFNGDQQILDMMKEKNWGMADIEKIVMAYNKLE